MTPEKWKEISKIFNAALALEKAERIAFLRKECGEDAAMLREIELLIAASDQQDSFIDSPPPALASGNSRLNLAPKEQIGAFEIIKMLGSGGMGEVYLAKDLRLNRQVALKFLSLIDENSTRRFIREAQAAASLEHPHICTIHEIAKEKGREFIVMQYVDGETLSSKIKRGNLKRVEILDIAIQVADALKEAHARGIIHRDIKPANIIISPNNQAKVLDFGLAKRVAFDDSENSQSLLSQAGMIVGTVSYMSPEQIRGRQIDARSDLWSLGVVLYEMIFGRIPFARDNTVEKLAAILYEEPQMPEEKNAELLAIITKALEKSPEKRYQSAEEFIEGLRTLKRELEFTEQLEIHATNSSGDKKISEFLHEHSTVEMSSYIPPKASFGWKKAIAALAAVGILFAGASGFWNYYSSKSAAENLQRVEELAKAEKNFEAYDIALKIEGSLGGDNRLAAIWPVISDTISVNSEPPGAKIYLRRFQADSDGKFPERILIGETPLENKRIARGQYILQLEKEGFAPFERTISGTIPRVGGSFIETPPLKVEANLLEKDKLPENMVLVKGSEYNLVNWSRPTENKVALDDFFIDKYEVSNAEFKEFINAGGYVRPELWKVNFKRDGKEISMQEALAGLKDKTGLPAPRSWSNQNFPPGKDQYPVTDITWYEAAAYAEFRGKSLPSVFQWEKAARDGMFDPRYNAMPWGFIKQGETTDNRANFRGSGVVAVSANEFGMSPFGAFNMAGNVSEWNLNQSPEGYVTSGGAWNDLAYSFGDYGEYPALYTSDRIGFRCVKNLSDKPQGALMLPPAEVPQYPVSSDSDFKIWLTHYEYDKEPLNSKIIETSETDDWRREKIEFRGEGGEAAIGYLYLPKNFQRPLSVVHYLPPGDVIRGLRSLPDSIEMFAMPLIKSGRAVFAVVLKGYIERPYPASYSPPPNSTIEFRKQMVNWITDLRRGIDYIEGREDLEKARLGFLGVSNGANMGLILSAIETRYKSLAFVSAGLEKDFLTRIAETSPIKFASQVKTQKLILNGRYDETFPYNTDAKPLFKLLREPKKVVIYDGGHIPTVEDFAVNVNGWFDETLGKPSG